ncbi:ABC transporter ATP-binding protein [Heliophilum fasciatum]|uniref:Lipooligosaccharide transport system ATP-binding protein n=1 Tax=Heliophilum fasciatum TaxID=35700 RepID=A0A4V2SX58_9FIRM|nr:ABC transporter ATP-binding protein [Heliophilum fasciatum]MCW2277587.1 lipooligosaccharide transport system ATP-binding protein [Heliophilum fasciatum]TCP64936.1 lipooligosaccharide transport system ATP-binding protein [Heliophilum fasciatum]
MSCVVRAERLSKSYGSLRAVRDISFAINEGECFGFLGHNGAGKSTTLKMIYGLSTVDQGGLWLFDQKITLTPPSLKARLGVVPQEDNLDPDLTVLENLTVFGALFGLSSQEGKARATEYLQFWGLDDKVNVSPDELSGGLKRRLVIARALMNRPRLLILDEPTTGLDPQARHLVWQKLRLLKSEGISLVLTTHYMEEARQLCDRLVIMEAGQILAEGSPEQLVQEHVLPYVIEVHLPQSQVPAAVVDQVRAYGGQVETVADSLFFFAHDGNDLWSRLESWGLPPKVCHLRSAHLEDVYLKLTGTTSEEEKR